jgi:hypothetical protein
MLAKNEKDRSTRPDSIRVDSTLGHVENQRKSIV